MARQQQAPKAKGKGKRKFSSTLMWGLLGLVILTAGVVSALYYMNRDRIETDTRLRVIKDFVAKVDQTIEKGRSTLETTIEKGKSAAGVATEKLGSMRPEGMRMPSFGSGARSYTVKPGDNLFAIARESGLVDNPWQWRTILIQNRDKVEWAFINDQEQAWKVMIAEGQTLTVEPDGQPDVQPGDRKYAFQLASMNARQVARGEYVVRTLIKDGYYAYLYRHEEGGQTWYRIRSGFYDSEAKARAVGEEIRQRYSAQNMFPNDLWVMKPPDAELRGEGMVFGAQLVHPWVVELRERDTHADAVRDLRRVNSAGDFAYIWQTQNPVTKRFIYRVRIGFFGTEDAAKGILGGRSGEPWDDAHTVKVDKLEETLPGQPMILGQVRS